MIPLNDLTQRLANFHVSREHVVFRNNPMLEAHLRSLPGVDVQPIGASRNGQQLYGTRFGSGPLRVSIVAGSHADEPTGPMTAQPLPLLLQHHFPEFLDACTFHVIPQINPDGADANRAWFDDPPDIATYVQHAQREQPGDDIEFGFGDSPAARPECRAAMCFLRAHGPYRVHASLHGMGYAYGGWFLICKEWAHRAAPMMDALANLCTNENMPQHDIDRHGDKGFHRIRKGFCTTPTSTAMGDFFLQRDDPTTAALFLPSSMEFAQSLGGDPLCLVSEMPLFLIPGKPTLDPAAHQEFRDAVAQAKAQGSVQQFAAVTGLTPLPFAMQMKLQLAMLLTGIALAGR